MDSALRRPTHRSPRDFRVLVAASRRFRSPWRKVTAVPAISECLWRPWLAATFQPQEHRSPRDFRVLVAAEVALESNAGRKPQSPRFQSACGGGRAWLPTRQRDTAVPAISECLWRVKTAAAAAVPIRTAVPAISECLWR